MSALVRTPKGKKNIQGASSLVSLVLWDKLEWLRDNSNGCTGVIHRGHLFSLPPGFLGSPHGLPCGLPSVELRAPEYTKAKAPNLKVQARTG